MKKNYETVEIAVIEITDVISTSGEVDEKPGITLPDHDFLGLL